MDAVLLGATAHCQSSAKHPVDRQFSDGARVKLVPGVTFNAGDIFFRSMPAELPGVRRSGMAVALHVLEGERIIRSRRGARADFWIATGCARPGNAMKPFARTFVQCRSKRDSSCRSLKAVHM